ncbi:MAG: ABC transporter ATP-binding protein [Planctomycetia bacterium]|nr:ABC transporter ATP-binding protein [Planctomycetia bacterium]
MMDLIAVTKIYQQGSRTVNAVRGVTMRIDPGEFVSIVGPSGSGKSTLMHLLGALDTPSTGKALFLGKDIARMSDRERSMLRRNRIGFIFQFFNLIRTMTACENVALPLLLGGNGRSMALRRAAESLDRVGLRRRADHYPDEMSGGEMQRVAIARALVGDPEAILCDEPTGNLDSANAAEVLRLLRDLPNAGRRSVVMVTHDATAAAYGNRTVVIRDGLLASHEVSQGSAPVEKAAVRG